MNAPTIIGRQTFDGLGRQLTVEVGGHTTRLDYTDGQLPPSSTTLADGKNITFTYEKALNNQLVGVAAAGEADVLITRHPTLGQPSAVAGALGTKAFAFTPSGQPANDTWTVDGQSHHTAWRYSFGGLLQGFDDAEGVAHLRQLDAVGRVEKTRVGDVDTYYTYDALSRPLSIRVVDPHNQRTLVTSLTYDVVGREHTRTFTFSQAGEDDETAVQTIIQTVEYSALDQIISRTWAQGGHVGEETFEYDARNRLIRCTANALAAPEDPYGNRMVEQVFVFNAFNGYEKVVSTYLDGTRDEACFSYASDDPTRVVTVTHTHPSWPSTITLTYDACGRVIGDNLGRSLSWNTQGRLTEVRAPSGTCTYRYDPSGQLTDRVVNDTLTRDFFSADQLTHKRTDDNRVQLIGDMGALFAVSNITDSVRQTILVGTDAQGSVRLEADSELRIRRYTAHGAETSASDHVAFGYAGEQREPVSGWYVPGGNRPYDPVLMCFLAPDSHSPFGPGGINAYAWCAGDPVNRVDPDGHNWVSYALAGVGLALGALALIPGLQAALPAAGALIGSGLGALTTGQITALVAATLDIVSLATGVASTALEATGQNGAASGVLGSISLVTGLAGAGAGFKLSSLRRAGSRQRALDVTQGWKPPKPGRLGNGEVLAQHTSRAVDVGFIDTYHATNRAALLTHGDPLRALLMGADGKVSRAADVARDVIAPRLQTLNETADQTFVLLSCWGGSNGSALEIAKVLNRPVQGFVNKVYLKGFAGLQSPINSSNRPLEAVSFFERLQTTGNPIKAWKTTFREARANIYHPDGTVTPV
ncbi:MULTISPECIES: RHS repeat-associated core domain-containing protein [unclassified Pseudomonas]|uniref:RHS repeat-associated core domain-containing protein n=1 Tax=unclassified Pseudomonas TaxID=196821 RepID=UPI001314C013|nr:MULTISPECIES: RHS repeat-associated core domain-containing protein [unclassified Pseudomonas]